MPEIKLTQGFVTEVDECDADLAEFSCYASRANKTKVYASVMLPTLGKYKQAAIHRTILARMLGRELQPGELTDHIDGNTLNNRRENLRVATPQQNAQNRKVRSDSTTGVKGTRFVNGRWQAWIYIGKTRLYLGTFDTADDALQAYLCAAEEHFGQFATARSDKPVVIPQVQPRKIRPNKTGYTGVYHDARSGRYRASFRRGKRSHYIGSFSTAREAHEAYIAALDADSTRQANSVLEEVAEIAR